MADEDPPSIEVPHTGNKIADWTVHSVSANVITKLSTILIAVMVPVLGWMGVSMWDANKETVKKLEEATVRKADKTDAKLDDIVRTLTDIKVLQTTLENLNSTVNARFDAQGKRIDKHDRDIDEMRRELYYHPPTPTQQKNIGGPH